MTARIREILEDKKAENIVILDVRGRSTVTDYMIFANGGSPPHIRALYEDVQHRLKQEGIACYRRSGETEGGWMVLDYVSVIIHLFLAEVREYYALEKLWEEGAAAPAPDVVQASALNPRAGEAVPAHPPRSTPARQPRSRRSPH